MAIGGAVASYVLLVSMLVSTASACVTDLDCSLNGVCTAGSCVCDAGWTSTSCGQLALAPTNASEGRNRAFERGGSSSWGAAVLPDDAGLYHMFYTRFELGCGLTMWINNSVIAHAVSTSPFGPFQDVDVAMPLFATNPKLVRATDGTYLLFYIGFADDPPTRMCNCSANGGSESTCRKTYPPPTSPPGDGRAFVTYAYSNSLYGPWTRHGSAIITPAGGWELWLSNPAPWVRADGSVLLAYRSWGPSPPGSAVPLTEYIGVAAAPSWQGAYVRLSSEPIALGEDPFIWDDARGNLHVLTHNGCGFGHSFALASNASNWTAGQHALSCNVTWVNGSSSVVARRERPQLLFAADGSRTPIAVYAGVQPHPLDVTDASFTMATRVLSSA